MADPSPLSIAFDFANAGVEGQKARLDNIRARAATLISAASIVTSFLGAEALKDTQPGPRDTLIPDRSLELPELFAITAFLGVGVCCLWILWPRWHSWPFAIDANVVVGYANQGASTAATQRRLVETLEENYSTIEGKLRPLFWFFHVGVLLLGVEVVCWLADLT
jgi:hypothetical protein